MGYWKIDAWKEDSKGNKVDLTDADYDHIAEMVKEGSSEGEITDGDEE